MPFQPSSQAYLGSHRLLNAIGSGRHCAVWDAMVDAKGERRAIKILLKLEREQIQLMRHEFAVAQGLDHPNVIHIYEFNIHQETPYLAMEYFPSINLKQYLLQYKVEKLQPQLNSILVQAALGLGYFHDRGWVHRDIKPDNYLISEDIRIKLIDFALAEKKKSFFSGLLGGRGRAIQGTRSYMSPEQIRGEGLDQRSDIYSYACTAYELVTGRLPFTGSNTNELLNKHLKSTPPPLEMHNKLVTPGFSALMKKMLSKKPSDRPANLSEVAAEIKAHGVVKGGEVNF
ncbi:MAG: serine/threonine-protein kinase [Pirellulales bacterium]|nr:serine/threonine-protein kinase [Pirellulales bacterium]